MRSNNVVDVQQKLHHRPALVLAKRLTLKNKKGIANRFAESAKDYCARYTDTFK